MVLHNALPRPGHLRKRQALPAGQTPPGPLLSFSVFLPLAWTRALP